MPDYAVHTPSPGHLTGSVSVSMPWPASGPHPPIVPVFLPFAGCPVRCVFCAQDVQTGATPAQTMAGRLAAAAARLHPGGATATAPRTHAAPSGAPGCARDRPLPELAFYGGTFTALPEADLEACLTFAKRAQTSGRIAAFRCSTRPDAVDMPVLRRLRAAGCTTVELGVQSFSATALALSGRGYAPDAGRRACALVRAAGLKLGIQLMPGMPGVTPAVFLDDVAAALACGADFMRFYPCLVLDGTGLAALWREGRYRPWSLEMTLDTLAAAWLLAARAGVPVIRMGLAPENGLDAAILAGPGHAALGSRVQGRALVTAARQCLNRLRRVAAGRVHGSVLLELPDSCRGYFWGHKGELRAAWEAMGISRTSLRFGPDARLRLSLRPPDISGAEPCPGAQKRGGHRGGTGGR